MTVHGRTGCGSPTESMYCRAVDADIPVGGRLCANCPLCGGNQGDCVYTENGKAFPDFVDGIRWSRDYDVFQRAIQYAAEAHEGTHRKGRPDMPYISHPMEAAMIARTMTDDPEVLAAAALHDVVEDTPHTMADIEREFGERIAGIVGHESEDKHPEMPPSESWELRKRVFLDNLRDAPIEAKMVALADKLSNMRSMAEDHARDGDAMWEKFNMRNPSRQEWYYRSVAEALRELSGTEAWKEYIVLCDEVFGRQRSVRRSEPSHGKDRAGEP